LNALSASVGEPRRCANLILSESSQPLCRADSVPLPALLALMVAIVALLPNFGHAFPLRGTADGQAQYVRIINSFSVLHPGLGMTDYPGPQPAHIPKAYAVLLMAELNRANYTQVRLSTRGRFAGEWLLDNADLNRNGIAGWGVPAAWDAYGDGTVNPENTEYTISTAIVVKALMDWEGTDPQAPRDRIRATVAAALTPYLDPEMRSPAGLFPYSLHTNDRKFDTFNPAAYLAGQMQRWSRMAPIGPIRQRAIEAADSTVKALLAHKQVDATDGWYWHYSIQERVPNDLAHAGYIIEGLREYAAAGGRLAAGIDVGAIHRHLNSFLDPMSGAIRGWPIFRSDVKDSARLYDIGMGLYLAATAQPRMVNMERAFLSNASRYRRADGRFMIRPARSDGAPVVSNRKAIIREYECYLLYGLSHFSYGRSAGGPRGAGGD
jgi:hypothetical protein